MGVNLPKRHMATCHLYLSLKISPIKSICVDKQVYKLIGLHFLLMIIQIKGRMGGSPNSLQLSLHLNKSQHGDLLQLHMKPLCINRCVFYSSFTLLNKVVFLYIDAVSFLNVI